MNEINGNTKACDGILKEMLTSLAGMEVGVTYTNVNDNLTYVQGTLVTQVTDDVFVVHVADGQATANYRFRYEDVKEASVRMHRGAYSADTNIYIELN